MRKVATWLKFRSIPNVASFLYLADETVIIKKRSSKIETDIDWNQSAITESFGGRDINIVIVSWFYVFFADFSFLFDFLAFCGFISGCCC